MDETALAGMIFTLLLAMIVGGFILLFPLSRRLAAVLEQRLREQRAEPDPEGLEALRNAVHALEAEVHALVERQAFVDSLLAGEEPSRLVGSAAPRANAGEPGARAAARP
ncbi:MAG TPA: hypothetical protein VF188_10140 [Longimicrobiales bacterium]